MREITVPDQNCYSNSNTEQGEMDVWTWSIPVTTVAAALIGHCIGGWRQACRDELASVSW